MATGRPQLFQSNDYERKSYNKDYEQYDIALQGYTDLSVNGAIRIVGVGEIADAIAVPSTSGARMMLSIDPIAPV
jgi:hypothetical protein